MTIGTPLLEALIQALGDSAVLRSDADMAGYTEDWRGRYKGAALCVALPGSTRQVADIVRLCNDYATPRIAARRQHQPVRRRGAGRGRPAARYRQPVAPAPDPPRGPGQQFDGSRSRLRAGHGAAGRGGTRPPVPHQPGRGRFVPDRRHHRHQRGRHRRAALRQYARQHPGPGGRAARRIDLERPDRLAQEQYGFRPEALVHRRRRHLGHRDRGRAEAAPPCPTATPSPGWRPPIRRLRSTSWACSSSNAARACQPSK